MGYLTIGFPVNNDILKRVADQQTTQQTSNANSNAITLNFQANGSSLDLIDSLTSFSNANSAGSTQSSEPADSSLWDKLVSFFTGENKTETATNQNSKLDENTISGLSNLLGIQPDQMIDEEGLFTAEAIMLMALIGNGNLENFLSQLFPNGVDSPEAQQFMQVLMASLEKFQNAAGQNGQAANNGQAGAQSNSPSASNAQQPAQTAQQGGQAQQAQQSGQTKSSNNDRAQYLEQLDTISDQHKDKKLDIESFKQQLEAKLSKLDDETIDEIVKDATKIDIAQLQEELSSAKFDEAKLAELKEALGDKEPSTKENITKLAKEAKFSDDDMTKLDNAMGESDYIDAGKAVSSIDKHTEDSDASAKTVSSVVTNTKKEDFSDEKANNVEA